MISLITHFIIWIMLYLHLIAEFPWPYIYISLSFISTIPYLIKDFAQLIHKYINIQSIWVLSVSFWKSSHIQSVFLTRHTFRFFTSLVIQSFPVNMQLLLLSEFLGVPTMRNCTENPENFLTKWFFKRFKHMH